jgi:uncharacterized iron-regulated membrane protein
MTARKLVLKIHLWLGLSSGLVVLFLGLTGCILAFQKEIETATQPYRYVNMQKKEFLPPSAMKKIGAGHLPNKHMHAVLYGRKEDATQIIFFQFEPDPHYYIIYADPYNGQVKKVKNMHNDFFYQILQGHFYLWLPPEVGQPIVATATLIFMIMMISGLILWWPKNKAARKQRFTIKGNTTWRRKNYDLHNVLGFYVMSIAFIIAFTGLIWGFQWFAQTVYTVAGGKNSLTYQEPVSSSPLVSSSDQDAIDMIWEKMKAENPGAELLEVHIPADQTSPIAANANPDAATYWKTDYRYFDKYSLKELPALSIYGKLQDAAVSDKLIRMNYDIHTGGILGLPGKILMFFASLIASSLPVTGFCIWLGRRKKNRAIANSTVEKPELATSV